MLFQQNNKINLPVRIIFLFFFACFFLMNSKGKTLFVLTINRIFIQIPFMKAASLKDLKIELTERSHSDLLHVCLQLAKFKKENKEWMTYHLFEAADEAAYVQKVQAETDALFAGLNTKRFFYMKKSIRKILRILKTRIRYSKKKTTEVELLLYFCHKLGQVKPSIRQNSVLKNLYLRELASIEKKTAVLHEDLQYEYHLELKSLQL